MKKLLAVAFLFAALFFAGCVSQQLPPKQLPGPSTSVVTKTPMPREMRVVFSLPRLMGATNFEIVSGEEKLHPSGGAREENNLFYYDRFNTTFFSINRISFDFVPAPGSSNSLMPSERITFPLTLSLAEHNLLNFSFDANASFNSGGVLLPVFTVFYSAGEGESSELLGRFGMNERGEMTRQPIPPEVKILVSEKDGKKVFSVDSTPRGVPLG